MRVKEVIIDGFKSYANRTVISGWDASFNAITGLNGSGKSNILDAICFVLGITNLGQVRVNNLQELVYKQGQSRVTKASVSIIFDNRDTKSSPVGYEQYEEITVQRQVVIGGKNKYLINGHTAQMSTVQNLFQSVQLNVNNPHFLIMQGRITKVCNMKPPEILGMIEEAAGTLMYERKKQAALKTIQKKQTKVDEINNILLEDISPQLETLRKERSSFIEYSANNTEMERLQRFTVAHNYHSANNVVNQSAGNLTAMMEEEANLKEQTAELKDALSEKVKRKQALLKEKQDHVEAVLKDIEDSVAEDSKELVKHTAIFSNKEKTMKAEMKARKEIASNIEHTEKLIVKKKKEMEKFSATLKDTEKKHVTMSEHLSSLQSSLIGIDMSDTKKQQGTLTNQLMEAQKAVAQAESGAKQLHNKAKHAEKELKEKVKGLNAVKKEHKDFEKAR